MENRNAKKQLCSLWIERDELPFDAEANPKGFKKKGNSVVFISFTPPIYVALFSVLIPFEPGFFKINAPGRLRGQEGGRVTASFFLDAWIDAHRGGGVRRRCPAWGQVQAEAKESGRIPPIDRSLLLRAQLLRTSTTPGRRIDGTFSDSRSMAERGGAALGDIFSVVAPCRQRQEVKPNQGQRRSPNQVNPQALVVSSWQQLFSFCIICGRTCVYLSIRSKLTKLAKITSEMRRTPFTWTSLPVTSASP